MTPWGLTLVVNYVVDKPVGGLFLLLDTIVDFASYRHFCSLFVGCVALF
jgi:hypothetical protein